MVHALISFNTVWVASDTIKNDNILRTLKKIPKEKNVTGNLIF